MKTWRRLKGAVLALFALALVLTPTKVWAVDHAQALEEAAIDKLYFKVSGFKVGEKIEDVTVTSLSESVLIYEPKENATYKTEVCTVSSYGGFEVATGKFRADKQYCIKFYAEKLPDYTFDEDAIMKNGVYVNSRQVLARKDKSDSVTKDIEGKRFSIISCVSVENGMEAPAPGEDPVTPPSPSKLDIKDADITPIADQTFNGSPIQVQPVVKYGEITLVRNTDYTVSVTDNIAPGTATLTITGIGDYTGTKTVTFKIVKKETTDPNPGSGDEQKPGEDPKPGENPESPTDVTPAPGGNDTGDDAVEVADVTLKNLKNAKKNKLTVSWEAVKGIKGYQLQYATNKNFKKGAKSKTISGKKKSVTLSGLKKKKTYYVRIRAYIMEDGKKVYGAWSKAKKIKIKK